MSLRTSAINNIRSFQVTEDNSGQALTTSLNNKSLNSPRRPSFNSFYYRDHVTLKNYPLEKLKQKNILRRQLTVESSANQSKQYHQCQVNQLIENIDVWKKITSNRNNILVHRNLKNNKQTCDLHQSISDRKQTSEEKYTDNALDLMLYKSNTVDNPLIQESFSVHEVQQHSFQWKHKFNQFQQESFTLHHLGNLKRKMNNQIFKMNKELLKNYLKEQKKFKVNFNSLVRDQNNLDSKVKKIKTLANVLGKQSRQKQQIFKFLSQQTHESQQHKNQSQEISESKMKALQISKRPRSYRFETQIYDSQKPSIMDRHVSLQKFKHRRSRTNEQVLSQERKKKISSSLQRKKGFFHRLKRQKSAKDVDNHFQKQWEKMDEQIRLKFRRQTQFILNLKKIKKRELNS